MDIRSFIFLSSVVLVISGSACKTQQNSQGSSSSGIPAWANDPGSVYNESRYLMAVGSGDSFEDARSRAFGNLAQVFRSQIDGTQELISEFTETQTNNEAFTSNETTRLLNTIKIGANEDLMNTEVLATEAGNDEHYYVLVGMNRSASAQIYASEIQNNSSRIDALTSESETHQSVFKRLGLAKQALLLANVNDNLARQLEIINPGSFDREITTERVIKMESNFNEIQEKAIVSIRMTNDNPVLREAVSKTIQRQGFSISNTGNSVLELTVNYSAQEANLNRDDAEFVIWDLSISITEPGLNRNYQTFTTRGRDGALSLSDAYKRAEFTASQEIENDFARYLTSELSNQN